MIKKLCLGIITGLQFLSCNAQAASSPIVLELFTSQSCSSCPAADALLREISAHDAAILPLSFHVHYWDNLGWKDTYSSPLYTKRQEIYSKNLHDHIYTPQLVVNGNASMVGSDQNAVKQAINFAKESALHLSISIEPDAQKRGLIITITTNNASQLPSTATIWEIEYERYAKTSVSAGENAGHVLESINNVTHIESLGELKSPSVRKIPINIPSSDGIAILVQVSEQGPVLGAANYEK